MGDIDDMGDFDKNSKEGEEVLNSDLHKKKLEEA